jgi:ABC-type bacteriocin/lantibiotic exporter with double-glycine peptidase domain
MMMVMVRQSIQGQAAYSKAGAYATEVISGVRTVASFASESVAAAKYDESLEVARMASIKGGSTQGVGYATTMFVMYGVYALSLWYGGEIVSSGVRIFNLKKIFKKFTDKNPKKIIIIIIIIIFLRIFFNLNIF